MYLDTLPGTANGSKINDMKRPAMKKQVLLKKVSVGVMLSGKNSAESKSPRH